ncbi:Hypothetical predicted protein [Cloeon dipterum]|uniref:Reverse transcriptase domain-containing protein n=2 Tax=Cloeon dipterum TaxID=197152 RepID=A0A8S1DPF6_9INSE|nr:Hypothetical predicted protein [Cloeon dipterum]
MQPLVQQQAAKQPSPVAGLLNVKVPALGKKTRLPNWKVWRSFWVTAKRARCPKGVRGVQLSLAPLKEMHLEEPGNKVSKVFVPCGSCIKRTSSRNKCYVFAIFPEAAGSGPALMYLAGRSESESQRWMRDLIKFLDPNYITAAAILCFNARSLKNKKRAADIAAFLEVHPADIIGINETWLSADIMDHEVIPTDYVVLRKDRIGGRRPAGGVLLAVLPHLQPRRQKQLETSAEAIWAAITVSNLRFLIASVYRAPNSTAEQNDELLRSFSLAAEQQHNYDACFVMGDLNLDIDWSAEPPLPRAIPAEKFIDAFDNLAFFQLIKNPTRTTTTSEKTIDLFLCDTPNLVSSSEVIAGVSDHDALLAELRVDSRRPTPLPAMLPNWRRAPWPTLNDRLAEEMQAVLQINNLNDAWTAWKTALVSCVSECVPSRKSRPKRRLLPWLDKKLKKMIKIKDELFAKWQVEKTLESRNLFETARRASQGAVRLAKDRWFWALGRGPGGAAIFWKFIHSKTKVPIKTTSFSVDGRIFSEPAAVASKFQESFKQNFSPPEADYPFLRRVPSQEEKLSEWRITESDVDNLLHVLDAKSATGPDGVPAVLLKRCAKTLCPSLAHIFNLSLRACDLPADWKCAAVTPIPKDGEKSDLRNYRPISVTSLVGKLLEKHVRNQLAGFLDTNKALPDNQHGFRERRSCTTMLLRTLDSWTAAIDKNSGGHVHAIFLDWAKAFDKVPHQRLLSKLQHHGIDGAALEWLKNFLVGRSQFVRFGGARSEPCVVSSGVVQGSVLGPLLFNVYVSDLPAVVKTNLVQYADDCTIFREVTSQDDVDELQEDLALIDIWCVNNGMQLNAKKCVAMDLSRARQPWLPQYMIGGAVLEYVSTQRLLGVHIARDLRWNHHVDVQRKKAAQTLGFAARNLRGCTQRVKRMAYLTLVKPKLFYGTPAWHPWTKTNTEKMARTQNKALHFIHGRHVPPPEKQNMLSVPAQLAYNDLLFFKKSLCGLTEYNAMARITEGRVHRGDDPLHPRLQQPPARTELGQNAFDYRIVAEWNAAPPAIKDCTAAQFPAVYIDDATQFEVTTLPNGLSVVVGLSGMIGLLGLRPSGLALRTQSADEENEQGRLLGAWGWKQIDHARCRLGAAALPEDDGKICVIRTTSLFPGGAGDMSVFCARGRQLVKALQTKTASLLPTLQADAGRRVRRVSRSEGDLRFAFALLHNNSNRQEKRKISKATADARRQPVVSLPTASQFLDPVFSAANRVRCNSDRNPCEQGTPSSGIMSLSVSPSDAGISEDEGQDYDDQIGGGDGNDLVEQRRMSNVSVASGVYETIDDDVGVALPIREEEPPPLPPREYKLYARRRPGGLHAFLRLHSLWRSNSENHVAHSEDTEEEDVEDDDASDVIYSELIEPREEPRTQESSLLRRVLEHKVGPLQHSSSCSDLPKAPPGSPGPSDAEEPLYLSMTACAPRKRVSSESASFLLRKMSNLNDATGNSSHDSIYVTMNVIDRKQSLTSEIYALVTGIQPSTDRSSGP